ncbi:MAG: ATP-grasp domain-containing protein [Phycisphaerae bacterium]|nr:ATP-grasp domain-containing protein [Phycisphaerae bacterium]
MKVAVVYNRESRKVINLFGTANRETIALQTIKRITDALKKGGHQVTAFEGDKDLVDKLEHFMPRVVKGERPGMVFNVSYGIQGQARYTHVPSILEMVGIPYVASGPLAHSLALDKVVTKMILRQQGLPTPDFAVLTTPNAPLPDLTFPLIVKPKNEAVSFGLRVVNSEDELRQAARIIHDEYQQPVLVEQYIDGREINVGLLGNSPPEALPPVELHFGDQGPAIYTFEDKTRQSGRTISHTCPAPIGEDLCIQAQSLAIQAFTALGCFDCARVDMRLDHDGNLYILEVNSLPSLGEYGSYLIGAEHVGLDFTALVNRLVEAASARYFGTPEPPKFDRHPSDPPTRAFSFVTQHRDKLERRLEEWTNFSSLTDNPIGLREAVQRVGHMLCGLGMKSVREFTDEPATCAWQTTLGFGDGALFIGHLDVPVDGLIARQMFRREPEWLYGEGIGSSRAPLVMLEFALRALRSTRQLPKLPIGVLYYTDEGRDAPNSAEVIRAAASRAKRVFVLRPGNVGDSVVTQRRGQRKYRLRVEGESLRPGRAARKPEVLRWVWNKLEEFAHLTSRKQRLSVSAVDIQAEKLPMLLPHRVTATILVTFPDAKAADEVEQKMRAGLGKQRLRWELQEISNRPPMKERRGNLRLAKSLADVAEQWDIPLKRESSVWPSVAGLVPAKTACLCGIGPVARDLGTPHEAIQRISLVQRTLLLAEFLAKDIEK